MQPPTIRLSYRNPAIQREYTPAWRYRFPKLQSWFGRLSAVLLWDEGFIPYRVTFATGNGWYKFLLLVSPLNFVHHP